MKILLVCAAGMSTSLVVQKMQQNLKDNEKDWIINAKPVEEFKDLVKEYDVVLLGPQIRFKKAELEVIAKNYDVPVAVIDMKDYGMCRGDKVLEQARKLLNK
jgi:PTS system cellobiose-specific IIB component